MSDRVLFDALLRGFAAAVWIVATAGLFRNRSLLNGYAVRRILVASSLATVLTVIAIGPFLVAPLGAWFVQTLYTATAAGLAIVGLAFASTRSH